MGFAEGMGCVDCCVWRHLPCAALSTQAGLQTAFCAPTGPPESGHQCLPTTAPAAALCGANLALEAAGGCSRGLQEHCSDRTCPFLLCLPTLLLQHTAGLSGGRVLKKMCRKYMQLPEDQGAMLVASCGPVSVPLSDLVMAVAAEAESTCSCRRTRVRLVGRLGPGPVCLLVRMLAWVAPAAAQTSLLWSLRSTLCLSVLPDARSAPRQAAAAEAAPLAADRPLVSLLPGTAIFEFPGGVELKEKFKQQLDEVGRGLSEDEIQQVGWPAI